MDGRDGMDGKTAINTDSETHDAASLKQHAVREVLTYMPGNELVSCLSQVYSQCPLKIQKALLKALWRVGPHEARKQVFPSFETHCRVFLCQPCGGISDAGAGGAPCDRCGANVCCEECLVKGSFGYCELDGAYLCQTCMASGQGSETGHCVNCGTRCGNEKE